MWTIAIRNYSIDNVVFDLGRRFSEETMRRIMKECKHELMFKLLPEMAYESSTQKPESQRTVVSNIHRLGMPPVEAGAQIVSIVEKMMEEKTSGIDLKL